jgi:hypothetical protein
MTTIRKWHIAHPDVWITLANAADILSPEQRRTCYETALSLYPLNAYYYQTYLTFLLEQRQYTELHRVFTEFITKACQMTGVSTDQARPIIADDAILPYLNPELFSVFSGTASFSETASKVLYTIGLSSLSNAPTLTGKLWSLAKDISPSWGLFHRELASYYIYSTGDKKQAWKTLVACQNHDSPKEACNMDMDVFPDLLTPGALQTYIKMIPVY